MPQGGHLKKLYSCFKYIYTALSYRGSSKIRVMIILIPFVEHTSCWLGSHYLLQLLPLFSGMFIVSCLYSIYVDFCPTELKKDCLLRHTRTILYY